MSSESANTASAFLHELTKRIGSLPSRPNIGVKALPVAEQRSHLKISKQIMDAIVFYTDKLPDHISVPVLIEFGESLLLKDEWSVALSFFNTVRFVLLSISHRS